VLNFTPTQSGEWSPSLPGLDRLRLKWVVLVQLIVTILMVGMIWTVHLVHYALFPLVGTESWDAYEHAHVDRIGKVLFGPWLLAFEVASVLILAAVIGGIYLAMKPAESEEIEA